MYTINEVENINNKEIKDFLIRMNHILKGRVIDNKKNNKILPDENSENINRARYELAKFLSDRFFNYSLTKSLNMSDDLEYYKQLLISKNCLFKKDIEYYFLLTRFIYTEEGNGYIQFIKFLDSINYNVYNDIKNKLYQFSSNYKNKYILFGNPDTYNSLNEELKNLCKCEQGIMPLEFKQFKNGYYNLDDFELFNMYKNKKKGNIGEILSYDTLSYYKLNPLFVSKDFGNGYGFDLHINNGKREGLFESKATYGLIDDSNDFFSLSLNEHNVMLDTLNKENVNYYVLRVFLDLRKDCNLNEYKLYHGIRCLHLIDENTFKGEDGTIYKSCENNKVFKKIG